MTDMPICSICEAQIEAGSSYVALLSDEDSFAFIWGCEHHPVENATLYFGSEVCALEWLKDHPECVAAYNVFMTTRHSHKKKKPYTKPELRIYGDIRGMTESTRSRHSRHDSGKGRLKTA